MRFRLSGNNSVHRHVHLRFVCGRVASGSRIAWPLRWIANPVVSHLGSSNLPCRANHFEGLESHFEPIPIEQKVSFAEHDS